MSSDGPGVIGQAFASQSAFKTYIQGWANAQDPPFTVHFAPGRPPYLSARCGSKNEICPWRVNVAKADDHLSICKMELKHSARCPRTTQPLTRPRSKRKGRDSNADEGEMAKCKEKASKKVKLMKKAPGDDDLRTLLRSRLPASLQFDEHLDKLSAAGISSLSQLEELCADELEMLFDRLSAVDNLRSFIVLRLLKVELTERFKPERWPNVDSTINKTLKRLELKPLRQTLAETDLQTAGDLIGVDEEVLETYIEVCTAEDGEAWTLARQVAFKRRVAQWKEAVGGA